MLRALLGLSSHVTFCTKRAAENIVPFYWPDPPSSHCLAALPSSLLYSSGPLPLATPWGHIRKGLQISFILKEKDGIFFSLSLFFFLYQALEHDSLLPKDSLICICRHPCKGSNKKKKGLDRLLICTCDYKSEPFHQIDQCCKMKLLLYVRV